MGKLVKIAFKTSIGSKLYILFLWFRSSPRFILLAQLRCARGGARLAILAAHGLGDTSRTNIHILFFKSFFAIEWNLSAGIARGAVHGAHCIVYALCSVHTMQCAFFAVLNFYPHLGTGGSKVGVLRLV